MNRKEFLSRLAGFGILLLPLNRPAKKKKEWLLRFHVRGFPYYQGPELLGFMSRGEKLELQREPANRYDRHAIALYYRSRKIGYVPREKNELLSRLLDYQTLPIRTEILAANTSGPPWQAVEAGIWAGEE